MGEVTSISALLLTTFRHGLADPHGKGEMATRGDRDTFLSCKRLGKFDLRVNCVKAMTNSKQTKWQQVIIFSWYQDQDELDFYQRSSLLAVHIKLDNASCGARLNIVVRNHLQVEEVRLEWLSKTIESASLEEIS
jgi:hypothetical protein